MIRKLLIFLFLLLFPLYAVTQNNTLAYNSSGVSGTETKNNSAPPTPSPKFSEKDFPREILYPIYVLYRCYQTHDFSSMIPLSKGKFLDFMNLTRDSTSDDLNAMPPVLKNFILHLKDMNIVNGFVDKNNAVVTVFWILEVPDARQPSGYYKKINETNYLLIKENFGWKILDVKPVSEFTMYDKRQIQRIKKQN